MGTEQQGFGLGLQWRDFQAIADCVNLSAAAVRRMYEECPAEFDMLEERYRAALARAEEGERRKAASAAAGQNRGLALLYAAVVVLLLVLCDALLGADAADFTEMFLLAAAGAPLFWLASRNEPGE